MTKTTNNTATSKTAAPSFEFFEGNVSVSSSRPQITLRKGGLIVLSRATVDMLKGDAPDDVTHVQLAYNASNGSVGVRACELGTAGAYTLRSQKKNPARLIGGKRFFKHHDLHVTAAATYIAEDFGNGIVGFRFPDTAPPKPTDIDEAAPEKNTPTVLPKSVPSKSTPTKAVPTKTEPKKPSSRRKTQAAA